LILIVLILSKIHENLNRLNQWFNKLHSNTPHPYFIRAGQAESELQVHQNKVSDVFQIIHFL